MKKDKKLYKLNTLSDFHKVCGLAPPKHPLISLIDYSQVDYQIEEQEIRWIQNLYFIGLKRNIQRKFSYGQMQYDFDEGLVSFVAPQQLVHLTINKNELNPSGYILAFHPDFLWSTALAKTIKNFEFFGYDVNEALFLSEREEQILIGTFKAIEQEYESGIDKFTQPIIIAQIEVLLQYCERFYQRQFITRKKGSDKIIAKTEELLETYFNTEHLIRNGLPTVQYLANSLNISANYLGSLLKALTGQNAQQHIHQKLIDKAKEKLTTSTLSISEIAFDLGFEHSQSFSKLFKAKTEMSPNEFRKNFVI